MDDAIVNVTSACYGLLEFFPEHDPLKIKAKEVALEILADATAVFDRQGWVSMRRYFSPERGRLIDRLLGNIEILESYLAVAKNQRWLDEVNFLIITKEYGGIKHQLQAEKSKGSRLPALNGREENAPEIKGESAVLPTDHRKLEVEGDKQELLKSANENRIQPQFQVSPRQQQILDIMGKREKTQVADIIKEIPDVTKRTIRRDLDELLKNGKILRSGEWNQVFYHINGTNLIGHRYLS